MCPRFRSPDVECPAAGRRKATPRTRLRRSTLPPNAFRIRVKHWGVTSRDHGREQEPTAHTSPRGRRRQRVERPPSRRLLRFSLQVPASRVHPARRPWAWPRLTAGGEAGAWSSSYRCRIDPPAVRRRTHLTRRRQTRRRPKHVRFLPASVREGDDLIAGGRESRSGRGSVGTRDGGTGRGGEGGSDWCVGRRRRG